MSLWKVTFVDGNQIEVSAAEILWLEGCLVFMEKANLHLFPGTKDSGNSQIRAVFSLSVISHALKLDEPRVD